ncbi:MAG: DUF3858 domain-containing protein [Bacteroidota bacterium]|nr:DUF3858 domain-containing protein [Bacteroidota bacterium]
MYRLPVIFILLILSINPAFSSKGFFYPVSSIDSALLQNAGMVVRLNEVVIDIRSFNHEVMKRHYIVTLLKGSESDKAIFKAFYNNNSSVDEFGGSMYDASGKQIKEFKEKDISDESAITSGTLYSDERVKIIRPVLPFYPVTLDFYSEVTIRKILFYPDFLPQTGYEEGVEIARLEIDAKEGSLPRFKEVRLPANTLVEGDGKTFKRWEFFKLKPFPEEPLGPALEQLVPVIYISPLIYSIKDYKGDFSTWQTFGKWVESLNEGRDSLPPVLISNIRHQVENIPDKEDKARKIYSYLQQSTRYVGVELGIGGLQPENASTVAKFGYGDCKGLVNYACAMLRYAGVQSWPVLINASDPAEPFQEDFPGNQFNHVILCVPLEKDTAWLECTSQRCPFGFLGQMTSDHIGLLLGPDGGKLIHTPVYRKNDNSLVRKTNIAIDPLGVADISLNACYRGQLYEVMDDMLFLSQEKQKENLLEIYDIPGMKIQSYSCSSEGSAIPSFTESIALNISNFASVSGNRMFIPLNRMGNSTVNFVRNDSRTCDLVLHDKYGLLDSVIVELPNGYSIESKPAPAELKTEFGSLSTEIRDLGSKVILVRRFERNNGTFPPEAYNDFAEFMRQVSKQDNKKLVLIKK